MAPEQAGGKKDVTTLCDVYALGAVLYEMVTGRPPFQAPTPMDTIMQVLTEEPVPPRGYSPACRATWRRSASNVCKRSRTSATPRPQELADDLARFREDRPIVARPVSRLERAWRWCRRQASGGRGRSARGADAGDRDSRARYICCLGEPQRHPDREGTGEDS